MSGGQSWRVLWQPTWPYSGWCWGCPETKLSLQITITERSWQHWPADRVISMVSENRSTVNKGKGIWNSKVPRKLSGNAFFRVLFLWTARFSVRCSAKNNESSCTARLRLPNLYKVIGTLETLWVFRMFPACNSLLLIASLIELSLWYILYENNVFAGGLHWDSLSTKTSKTPRRSMIETPGRIDCFSGFQDYVLHDTTADAANFMSALQGVKGCVDALINSLGLIGLGYKIYHDHYVLPGHYSKQFMKDSWRTRKSRNSVMSSELSKMPGLTLDGPFGSHWCLAVLDQSMQGTTIHLCICANAARISMTYVT